MTNFKKVCALLITASSIYAMDYSVEIIIGAKVRPISITATLITFPTGEIREFNGVKAEYNRLRSNNDFREIQSESKSGLEMRPIDYIVRTPAELEYLENGNFKWRVMDGKKYLYDVKTNENIDEETQTAFMKVCMFRRVLSDRLKSKYTSAYSAY